ncbi:hypothetical protein [Lyticum sinuosum]|uniref:Uncharacterized protein n=1 Tax=Lyticum sinuosum TaxID=1332059 RepID=A0AAE4VL06_9RICK|nr:hypothetical protein [Lyticum sinuosum]MDZ5761585.1 hypothetical protein [Lyticum sinuosum]
MIINNDSVIKEIIITQNNNKNHTNKNRYLKLYTTITYIFITLFLIIFIIDFLDNFNIKNDIKTNYNNIYKSILVSLILSSMITLFVIIPFGIVSLKFSVCPMCKEIYSWYYTPNTENILSKQIIYFSIFRFIFDINLIQCQDEMKCLKCNHIRNKNNYRIAYPFFWIN